ncbi:MAG: type VI secretion system protein TssA [Pyrinomonadaceae bacterium]
MSDELRIPPVIELEVLLQPISEESPSGESLRYSGIYDEIAEARRADDGLNQGDWKTEQKLADYGKVIELGVNALSTQSKDLQVAVWLSEAIARKHGFAGFRDSLLMLAGLQETFWDTLHPEIEEGDMEGRANAISWLDVQFPLAIKAAPITPVSNYSFNDWEDAKKFDFPDDMESLPSEEQAPLYVLKAQAEKEHRVTAALWAKEKSQTRRDSVERVNFVIEECWTALADLNRIIEEKYDRKQMPGLSNLKKTLEDIHTRLKLLLEEKRLEEPDPIEEIDEAADAGEGGSTGGGQGAVGGAINSRKEALKRLADIAGFFQKTEPHSPVSYLVQRAVKWGNMGLETWLQEVIKDESVLFQLRETLGVSGGGFGGDSGYGESESSHTVIE